MLSLSLHAPSGSERVSCFCHAVMFDMSQAFYLLQNLKSFPPFEYEMHQTVKAFMPINFFFLSFLRFFFQFKASTCSSQSS